MAEIKLAELKGWKAVAAIGVLLVLLILHQSFIRQSLDEEAIAKIQPYIQGEVVTHALGGRDPSKLSKTELQRTGEQMLKARNVELNNVTARGFGSEVVIRVEITVDGQPPPDGRSVRYYKMEHSYLTGWIYRREVTAFSYYTKLW